MLLSEIREVFNSIKQDKIIGTVACAVITLSLFIGAFFSAAAAVAVLLSYLLGFVVCWVLITYEETASFCLQHLASFYRGRISHSESKGLGCGICSKSNCKRHPNTYNPTPWKNLLVSKKFNDSLEHLYNRIIEDFVTSWYQHVSEDHTFLNEIRYCLRYANSCVFKRCLQLDVGHIVTNKLIPCIVKHVDDYMYMQQIANLKHTDINNIAVEYLGNRLHIAVTNRKNELCYLRHLTALLLPHILPTEYVKCKNYAVLMREIIAGWVLLPLMDVLADPNIINYITILAVTHKSKSTSSETQSQENVEFLLNFSSRIKKSSALTSDLKTIRKDTDLLYAFMQFLKKENSVHLLQFCLDVDEFNTKLLTPDLSKKELENLHKEATKLYSEYFDARNGSFIGCSDAIIKNFHTLLQGGVYDVAKFCTSEPLYQAYEHALNILEKDYLPQFFHSNEEIRNKIVVKEYGKTLVSNMKLYEENYLQKTILQLYSHICGSKVTATYNKSAVNKSRRYYEPVSQSTVSKISSGLGRIRGALRTNQPIEGALCTPEAQTFENDTIEELIVSDCSNVHRDLSTWRVSIPNTELTQIASKHIVLFNVLVQRLDVTTESERKEWVVQRKDQDFYTLKVKLIEFHGEHELSECPFPSRRPSTLVEVRRTKYDEFLKHLLQKPSLKGSDLLHTFLTSEQDFTLVVTNTITAVGDLGNIYQSMAYKLRKEKGQHLDNFMNTFLASTGRSKKFEWAELGDELDLISLTEYQTDNIPKTFKSKIFKDNYGVTYSNIKESTSSPFTPNSMTESIFYLLKYILKVPHGVLKLYAAICSVGQQAVDSLAHFYVEHKLKAALSQQNLAQLINLLENAIFTTHTPLTEEEMAKRRTDAFAAIDTCIPKLITKLAGEDLKKGLNNLLKILQNPLYNKQLMYNLVDIVLAQMYPQLNSCEAQ